MSQHEVFTSKFKTWLNVRPKQAWRFWPASGSWPSCSLGQSLARSPLAKRPNEVMFPALAERLSKAAPLEALRYW